MTSPRDSNTKDGGNNNQEDNMRELIATQNQLSQETTQLLANNNGLDPAIQKILKLQSQLLQGLVTQMINMRENFSQRANDNKDDKDVNLEGTQASNTCGDKEHTSKEHEDQCPKKRERSPTYEEQVKQVYEGSQPWPMSQAWKQRTLSRSFPRRSFPQDSKQSKM